MTRRAERPIWGIFKAAVGLLFAALLLIVGAWMIAVNVNPVWGSFTVATVSGCPGAFERGSCDIRGSWTSDDGTRHFDDGWLYSREVREGEAVRAAVPSIWSPLSGDDTTAVAGGTLRAWAVIFTILGLVVTTLQWFDLRKALRHRVRFRNGEIPLVREPRHAAPDDARPSRSGASHAQSGDSPFSR